MERATPVTIPLLQSTTPVLCGTTKYYSNPTATNYYSLLPQCYSVLEKNIPGVPCTTKYYRSTTLSYKVLLQYYSILHSTTSHHPALQRTTPILSNYHSGPTHYYFVPQSVFQYFFYTTKYYSVLRSTVPVLRGTIKCSNGLLIQSRMDTTMNNDASWTCRRSFDGALVQLDFVVSSSRMTLIRSWCDHCIYFCWSGPSMCSLHRCLHVTEPRQRSMTKRMRNWMPRLDSSNQPSEFQNFVPASLTSCYWILSSTNTNIAISSFAISSSISVTTAPCTKSTMSEITEPSDSITPS